MPRQSLLILIISVVFSVSCYDSYIRIHESMLGMTPYISLTLTNTVLTE